MTTQDAATKIARSAAARARSAWQHYRRVWIVLGVIAIGIAGYFGAGSGVAYTDDAYVRSDLVAIAPQVSGIVKTVVVADNQPVAAGDPTATIDPEPYQLDVALKQQQVASLEASVAVKTQMQTADAASVDAANAALR